MTNATEETRDVDLDELQAGVKSWKRVSTLHTPYLTAVWLFPLIAELRAARDVVEAVRPHICKMVSHAVVAVTGIKGLTHRIMKETAH